MQLLLRQIRLIRHFTAFNGAKVVPVQVCSSELLTVASAAIKRNSKNLRASTQLKPMICCRFLAACVATCVADIVSVALASCSGRRHCYCLAICQLLPRSVTPTQCLPRAEAACEVTPERCRLGWADILPGQCTPRVQGLCLCTAGVAPRRDQAGDQGCHAQCAYCARHGRCSRTCTPTNLQPVVKVQTRSKMTLSSCFGSFTCLHAPSSTDMFITEA
jgi:hypothetical protein